MKTEREEGVTRHYGDGEQRNWHKAEDRCWLCPFDELIDAAGSLPSVLGPLLAPVRPSSREAAALDRLERAVYDASAIDRVEG